MKDAFVASLGDRVRREKEKGASVLFGGGLFALRFTLMHVV